MTLAVNLQALPLKQMDADLAVGWTGVDTTEILQWLTAENWLGVRSIYSEVIQGCRCVNL